MKMNKKLLRVGAAAATAVGMSLSGAVYCMSAGESVPLRETLEGLGYQVGWDGSTRSITAVDSQGKKVSFRVGEAYMTLEDGMAMQIELNEPVSLSEGGVAYLPVSAVNKLNGYADEASDVSENYNINKQMDQNENYVISPYSLKSVLAMAANGADGTTKDELLSVLGYDSLDSLNADMKLLNERYHSDGELKINAANSLWINRIYPEVKEDFSQKMLECYDASIGRYSLKDIPGKIKAWVNEKSNGLQKDFNAQIDDDFAMGFVNTTYLKAKWWSSFESQSTRDGIFYNCDKTTAKTKFMHQSGYKMAYKDDSVTMVKLPYLDDDRNMSFYAAMAPEGTDLESYVDKLEKRKVELSLPKFKTHTNTSMNSIVQSLGAGTMFTSKADFGGIFKNSAKLYVSSIVQDTVIDVDEDGTEASSTTMMGMLKSSAYDPEEPLEINFNRSFTYFIMDDDSGEILFMGRYAKA
jgi:serpin B